MLPAHTLESIIQNLDQQLGSKVVEMSLPAPSMKIWHMHAGMPTSESEETYTVRVEVGKFSKLIGILFCPPTRRLGKEEIIPNLEYFHYRSESFVDFFCVGYGLGWTSDTNPDFEAVATVDSAPWLFSAGKYNSLRAEMEGLSRWEYSGETDLLLLAARKNSIETAYLDFSTAIACNLEAMQKDGAFSSVGAFFEQVFRFGQTFEGSDPIATFSDRMGLKRGKNFLEDGILSLLPDAVSSLYRSAKHYAISDISRN
jgi:hypothetical protein